MLVARAFKAHRPIRRRKLSRRRYRSPRRLESRADIPGHRAISTPDVPRLNRESTAPDLRSAGPCRATASASHRVPQDYVQRNRQFSDRRRQRDSKTALMVFVNLQRRGDQDRCIEERFHRFLPNIACSLSLRTRRMRVTHHRRFQRRALHEKPRCPVSCNIDPFPRTWTQIDMVVEQLQFQRFPGLQL